MMTTYSRTEDQVGNDIYSKKCVKYKEVAKFFTHNAQTKNFCADMSALI